MKSIRNPQLTEIIAAFKSKKHDLRIIRSFDLGKKCGTGQCVQETEQLILNNIIKQDNDNYRDLL